MLPKKYHALAFLSILVMLLLLGLHLLGFGILGGGGQASGSAARSAAAAALARNSTSGSSSSLLSSSTAGAGSTLDPNAVYRHPIVYDKLTGATNNAINDVLGGGAIKREQYPLDHYQQQQSQQVRSQDPFDPSGIFNSRDQVLDPSQQNNPFANHLAQSRQFNPHHQHPGHHHALRPPLGPPLGMGPPTHINHHQMPPPPPPPLPPPLVSHQANMITTQAPQSSQQQQQQTTSSSTAAAPATGAEQRNSQDSIPSASSVNNNGATRPLNATQQQPQYYQQQQQQPVYYTPPIFTYSNFDSPQQQQAQDPYRQPQMPPVGVPEVPLSVDDYNARQNRLRQFNNQQLNDETTKQQQQQPQVNLLADPRAQQRHKQQMLDRQLLFGPPPPPPPSSQQQQLSFMQPPSPHDNYTAAAYYPDPALYARLQNQQPVSSQIRPPYAHQIANSPPPTQTQLEAPTQLAQAQHQHKQLSPSNRLSLRPPERLVPSVPSSTQPRQQPLTASSVVRSGQQSPSAQTQVSANLGAASTRLPLQEQPAPVCARQQQQQVSSQFSSALSPLELANSTSQLPVLFCNEDPEYPTTDIMRALEQYAVERSIEQILPQQLVHMLTGASRVGADNPKLADLQRQLSLDSLQANIDAQQVGAGNSHLRKSEDSESELSTQQQLVPGIFPTSNYDALCKSITWMAQPRRAKNLSGQWKVVVNLPGHKFRGIAISQMVRMDECTRPNGECSLSPTTTTTTAAATTQIANSKLQTMPPRSRCLQHYDNQRLLAWSNQQGLHFDIFRVPIACSCHIRRF